MNHPDTGRVSGWSGERSKGDRGEGAPARHSGGAARIEWDPDRRGEQRDWAGPIVQGVHCTRAANRGGEWVKKSWHGAASAQRGAFFLTFVKAP